MARLLAVALTLSLARATFTDDTTDWQRSPSMTGKPPRNSYSCYDNCAALYDTAQEVACKNGCDAVKPDDLQSPGRNCATDGKRSKYPYEFYKGCYFGAMKYRKRLRGVGGRGS